MSDSGPVADFTNIIEGSKCPTSNLFVPMVAKMIVKLDPATILKRPWDGATCTTSPSTELYAAHVNLHNEMKERMVTNLKATVKAKFIISAMLDPRFKAWKFKGHGLFCDKDRAERYFQEEHSTNWAPVLAAAAAAPKTPSVIGTRVVQGKRSNAEAFLLDSDSESEQGDVAESINSSVQPMLEVQGLDVGDEMSLYLLEKECKMSYVGADGKRHQFDLLEWWKTHESKYPSLARMARQYLAMPATSAGVERLFSKAGRQFDDCSKNKGEEMLQHSLMAATNYVIPDCKYPPIKGGQK